MSGVMRRTVGIAADEPLESGVRDSPHGRHGHDGRGARGVPRRRARRDPLDRAQEPRARSRCRSGTSTRTATVLMGMSGDSLKAKLLRTAGRATLTVQTETPPYQYVMVDGPGHASTTSSATTSRWRAATSGPSSASGTRRTTRAPSAPSSPACVPSGGSRATSGRCGADRSAMARRAAARAGAAVPDDGDARARPPRLAGRRRATVSEQLRLKRRLIDEVPDVVVAATAAGRRRVA